MNQSDIRRRLAELAAMGAKATRAAGKISEAADDRRAAVQARIDELRPTVITDPAAADEYQALVAERGRLDMVIAGSRAA